MHGNPGTIDLPWEGFYSETGDIPGSSETRDLCHRSSLSAESRMDSEKMLKRGKRVARAESSGP